MIDTDGQVEYLGRGKSIQLVGLRGSGGHHAQEFDYELLEEWQQFQHFGGAYFRAFVHSIEIVYLHWPFFEMLRFVYAGSKSVSAVSCGRYANEQDLSDIFKEREQPKVNMDSSTAVRRHPLVSAFVTCDARPGTSARCLVFGVCIRCLCSSGSVAYRNFRCRGAQGGPLIQLIHGSPTEMCCCNPS